MLVYFLQRIPASDTREVSGVVISKGTTQGLDNSGALLVVKLKDKSGCITLGTNIQVGIRVGDEVLLGTYDRIFFSPRYEFRRKLVRNGMTPKRSNKISSSKCE